MSRLSQFAFGTALSFAFSFAPLVFGQASVGPNYAPNLITDRALGRTSPAFWLTPAG